MILGIDTAARLTGQQARDIKALGYGFAGRYLVPSGWKALTKQEAAAITSAGLKLLTVWETTAGRAKGGAAAGASDGARALECARNIEMPTRGIIYFAVDFGAQPGDMDAIEAYLRAARKETGAYEVGVYGPYNVIEEMWARKACKAFWQCVGWSYGQKSKHLDIYQSQWDKTAAGVAVDINECGNLDAAGIWDYQEDSMTGEEIYRKLNAYLAEQPLPDWAREELAQAVEMGITDGTRPMELVPRYQAAIMAKRAVEIAVE